MTAALPLPLRGAFPPHLAADVEAVLSRLPPTRIPPSGHEIGPVRVSGEPVHIPARLYAAEPSELELAALSDTQRDVLGCLYTRHHDGFVRQRHLHQILPCAHAWSVPFVVQLVGEYVLEIHHDIEANLKRIDVDNLARFVGENRPFIERTRQRVASYWDCYFRSASPDLRDHVAHRILVWMETVAEREK